MAEQFCMFSLSEKQVFKQGARFVAGVDEAGRGPWAGPVAGAAVAVRAQPFKKFKVRPFHPTSLHLGFFKSLPSQGQTLDFLDSKQLSVKQREEIFEMIKADSNLEWKVSFVWPQVIDRINIWRATQLAWQRCLKKLALQPDFLFLDGKMELPCLKIEQKPVIKGDQKILLLSLASIVAKVSRDKLMEKLAQKYPEYEFQQHKGYGTKLHLEKLKKFGPCQIHRKSFEPVFANLSFAEKVYYIVQQIPKGQAITYQQVAQAIGHPKAFRAVGNVLNKNTDSRIPCHRVIRSDKKIGGYNQGSQMKKTLLEKEGLTYFNF